MEEEYYKVAREREGSIEPSTEEDKEKNEAFRREQIEIQARLENRLSETRNELFLIRSTISDWFQTRYEDYDFADEFEITSEEINDLLESIGASQLQKAFEGSVTLEVSFKVRADSQDDAEAEIENYISDWGYDSNDITLSIFNTTIEFEN